MKTPKKSTTSKLIDRFDSQLKLILMSDLLTVRNLNANNRAA